MWYCFTDKSRLVSITVGLLSHSDLTMVLPGSNHQNGVPIPLGLCGAQLLISSRQTPTATEQLLVVDYPRST
jgi:hypothetical protein